MLKLLKYFFATFLLLGCDFQLMEDTPYDIFIVAGQSNTNQGLGLDERKDKAEEGIFQLGRVGIYDRMIITAQEPLQHHTARKNKIGFALTFSKLYRSFTEKKNPVLIVPCGYGGTSIHAWSTDGFLYKDMIDRTDLVMETYPQSTVKAILWHQGESDIGDKNYAQKLDTLIQNIRKDLNKDVAFILGGMVPYWVAQKPERIRQQEIIKTTPNRIENTAYADPEHPFLIQKSDNAKDSVHYDAVGQRVLGKRYYQAFLRLE